MNRVDRLHAILVHLQSKKRVTAQEIADRFGLSLRTVYRDIKALDEAGIPVIGEAGIGYSIMDGYRLPPILFTKDEAATLLLGSKLIQRFTDPGDRRNFENAMYKVKAVLRSSDKEFVEELDNRIEIRPHSLHQFTGGELHMTVIRQALVERRVIRIQYKGVYRDESTEREVEPIGLLYYSLSWHLIAFCRLRRDYRDFRPDRINSIALLDEKFDDTNHPSLNEYVEKLRCETELTEIVVSFDKNVAKQIVREKYVHGFVSEEEIEGRIRMRFLSTHLEYFCRWLLMFTDAVKVETPEVIAATMEKLMEELENTWKVRNA